MSAWFYLLASHTTTLDGDHTLMYDRDAHTTSVNVVIENAVHALLWEA